MAIIKCPGCRERVSDKRATCPHCGFGIADQEAGLSLGEAEARAKRKRRASLQMHSYAATLVFVAGIAWMLVESGGNVNNASYWSMFTTGMGIVWYFTVRIIMVLTRRG